jgi:hypothetical protein
LTISGDAELASNGPNRSLFPVFNNVRFAPPSRSFGDYFENPESRRLATLRHQGNDPTDTVKSARNTAILSASASRYNRPRVLFS